MKSRLIVPIVVAWALLSTTWGSARAAQSVAEQAAGSYHTYVVDQVTLLVADASRLAGAIDAGNLAQARQDYLVARLPYERIEPVADAWADLDADLDARVTDVPAGHWHGFHVIEQALYAKNSLAGQAPVAQRLLGDTHALLKKVGGLHLTLPEIIKGAVDLMDEVSKSKVTGEEERYSHLDIAVMAANVDGTRAIYGILRRQVLALDRALAVRIDGYFARMGALLRPLKHGTSYVTYGVVSPATKRAISQVAFTLGYLLSQTPGAFKG